ncbi:hypothetical protein [uncultured Tateyamaria sp.]|uniref:hypothetical protein n=1 Tax=uncultured Tateyamaria sp. TaxID=455651 RepID=UPI0026159884|nr:hypothetical protein [uncultured Tateyamaria sp.]
MLLTYNINGNEFEPVRCAFLSERKAPFVEGGAVDTEVATDITLDDVWFLRCPWGLGDRMLNA